MSMFRQLWLAIIVSTVLALCGGLLASLWSARSYLESQLSMKNADNATLLALSLSRNNPDPVTLDLVVASLFDGGHYEWIRIADPSGKIISERRDNAVVKDAPGWFVQMLPIQTVAGEAQINNGWQQFGTVTLLSHSRFAYGALWKSACEMALALSFAGLVGGFLASLVLRRIRRPLKTVIDQATAITRRHFVTVALPSVPELRKLAVAMNTTVSRLKAMFDEEATRLDQVRKEANFDPLTGLANKTHFKAQLRQAVEAEDAEEGVVLIARLANLASINQRLGRVETDDFLRAIGKVIGSVPVNTGHGVAARLGGADFALLLPGETELQALADKLLRDLVLTAAPYVQNSTTAWVGVGRYATGDNVSDILAKVDTALASASFSGVDSVRVVHRGDSDDLPRTAEHWAVALKQALYDGWVKLMEFAVTDMNGGLLHLDCSLRISIDGGKNWIVAGRFMPVAERLKMTAELDLAAVKLGLQRLQSDPDLPGVAINLSGGSLDDATFLDFLSSILDANRDLAPRLWLEMAEVGALKRLDKFKALCAVLNAYGCMVGLEHFGHLFSRIGKLHGLGLDYLKVDASFVGGVDANEGNRAYLGGLCNIAHGIGLIVFAEGVATDDEKMVLSGIGFDGVVGPAVHVQR